VVNNGRRVLAIEAAHTLAAEAIRSSLSWAQLDQIVFLDHIPVDKRHNAKIDYDELARQLRSADKN